MGVWLKNIWFLCHKEFKSVMSDVTLMGLVVAVFTISVYSVSTGVTTEVKNASIALIDNDHSTLSHQLKDAFFAPEFKPPVYIGYRQRETSMDKGEYVFIIDIPPNFERDVLAGKSPKIQVLADATAATLAGVGTGYIQHIIQSEIMAFLALSDNADFSPIQPVMSIMFNPNGDAVWYVGVMQVASNVTLLAMLLVGAAIIREKEHGTMEHLLVMPVRASEMVVAKIVANSLIILIAALCSLGGVVHLILGVPIIGSVVLFALGLAVYLFAVSSLGIYLATIASTMPQFGLLSLPIYIVSRLLSGGETPLESMPDWVQRITYFSPVTQFVSFSQDVLFRDADISIVWKPLFLLIVIGGFFLVFALRRFRTMLSTQG